MRYRVLPYRQGSKGAKALSQALGGKVLRLHGSSFIQRDDDVVINWGNTDPTPSTYASVSMLHILNKPSVIRNASNKRNFFRMMRDAGEEQIIPRFWENRDEIPSDAFPVVCRTVLAGHSGDGIVIAGSPDALVAAPLYVQYVKKQDEYRVHVGRVSSGEVNGSPEEHQVIIAVQRKARRNDVANPNWQIRNHQNGFVYVRTGVNPPPSVLDVARRALAVSSLDFAAIDVIWNEQQQRAFVLEANTAPGLEGQTILDYANFFRGG